ncbi:hypothetical protein [Amycolatopsis sp. NPDC051061]|uniref:hypothetical protein n=1 Tax=Amycolatopsis sp. NPDC051061 TaxID=3155042 RepID=UPI0034332BD1
MGVVIGDPRSGLWAATEWLSPEPGRIGIVLLEHSLRDVQALMEPLRVAQWDRRTPIRLYSCNANALDALAAGLADSGNVVVTRPVSLLWLG